MSILISRLTSTSCAKKTIPDPSLDYSNLAVCCNLKGEVICAAPNVPTKQVHSSDRAYLRSIHAEKNLVSKLRRRGLLYKEPYLLYSFRVRNGRVVRGGNPCQMCRELLNSRALKEIFIRIYYY